MVRGKRTGLRAKVAGRVEEHRQAAKNGNTISGVGRPDSDRPFTVRVSIQRNV